MGISSEQELSILTLLRTKLKQKIAKYQRETISMPFLTRLVQDQELVASYSFIHSLTTTFGMSIFEEVAVILGSETAEKASTKFKLGGGISSLRKAVIGEIIRDLRNGTQKPNKKREIERILLTPNTDVVYQKEGNIADFFMIRGGNEYYFEIKTVKPNIDVFTASKKKILEWVAIKDKDIKTVVALPYNPYAPDPYTRFTEQNLFDKEEELMVGEEFWNFVSGSGTYDKLLEIFDKVGKEYKESIDKMLLKAGKRVGSV